MVVVYEPREVDLLCLNCGAMFSGFYDPDHQDFDCPRCGLNDVEMN